MKTLYICVRGALWAQDIASLEDVEGWLAASSDNLRRCMDYLLPRMPRPPDPLPDTPSRHQTVPMAGPGAACIRGHLVLGTPGRLVEMTRRPVGCGDLNWGHLVGWSADQPIGRLG